MMKPHPPMLQDQSAARPGWRSGSVRHRFVGAGRMRWLVKRTKMEITPTGGPAGLRLVLAILAGLSFWIGAACAEVKLPALFSDHMVLQRDKPLAIWGWATPGEQIRVSLGNRTAATTTGADGRWRVQLEPQPMSTTPFTLTVVGSNTVIVKDVLLGDVWLCSGQSNMSISVGHFNTPEVKQDIAAADLPLVRHFGIVENFADEIQTDVKGEWLVSSPQTAARFSAVGFYFARKLHAETGVPQGVIRAAKGSTTIELWLSQTTLLETPELEPFASKMRAALAAWEQSKAMALSAGKLPDASDFPPYPFGEIVRRPRCVTLHNGMIAPLSGVSLRGVIWYQGEGNAGDAGAAQQYIEKQRALFGEFRRLFSDKTLPVYYVQLPAYRQPTNAPGSEDSWALLREAQRQSLSIPNTGMAITLDIGEAEDIHPKNKLDVGERLAFWALARDYSKTNLVYSGPLFRTMKIEGGKARLFFDSTGAGLMIGRKQGRAPTREDKGGKLQRFAIAGADKHWVWADAVIDRDTVVVSAASVPEPVAVRYAYAANPEGANLYNRAGLPAAPFRTDQWK
jgi:sialate O-acetylesterase